MGATDLLFCILLACTRSTTLQTRSSIIIVGTAVVTLKCFSWNNSIMFPTDIIQGFLVEFSLGNWGQ